MGTLGKVLLFVNLLAAAGVAYLAGQDWGKRQEVAAAALRYHVALKGVPVAAETAGSGSRVPFPVETAPGHTVETVRPEFLTALYQGADGGPELGDAGSKPATQVDEVKRVQGKLDSLIAGLDDAGRLARLAGTVSAKGGFTPGLLAGLAESVEEREYVRRLAGATGDAVSRAADDAKKLLDKKFAAVLNRPNPQAADNSARVKEAADKLAKADADVRTAYERLRALPAADPGRAAANQAYTAARQAVDAAQDELRAAFLEGGADAARDEADRRRRAAHLLTFLDPGNAWQTRVARVVGLRAYAAALAEQVDRARDQVAAVEQQIVLDQAAYAESYDLLQTLAAGRSQLLARQAGITADLQAQRARDLEAVNTRRAQLVKRQQDLADLQKQVADTLARQAEVEKTLFDTQRRIGDALQTTFDLEKKLDEAETKGK